MALLSKIGISAIAKRVFLTATPRHYDVRNKDKDGDKALIYSMDQPETYGPIVYTLSFAEAARQGIICNYKVIISVVTSDMLNADLLSKGEVVVEGDVVRARTVANQIAIQKACEEHDLKKVFSFHRNVASARDFTGDTASSIKAHLPNFEAYHVNGEMRTARREKEMRAFREADRAVMSNARCLTEGVDVPAVDVVAFLSPRKSKVDIVQAAGRAMRKADAKAMGYVLLPLFLETQENETIEEALKRTDFEEAWDVLQAMQEQDAVLAEIIREMREEKGLRKGFDDGRLRERVDVLGPEVSLDLLRSAVSTALIDRLGATWNERFGELRKYKDQFGDCNVPQRWTENPQLATWVSIQRSTAGKKRLSAERKARLDALGFDWDPRDAAWEQRFIELNSYKKRFGDCDVPAIWSENPLLGSWVHIQRNSQISGELSSERKARLDALGFAWDVRDAAWETMFVELQRYQRQHGHCNVPLERKGLNAKFGRWVSTQRTKKKSGELSHERISRLDELGFEWALLEQRILTTWEGMVAALKGYKEEHGHCNVPRHFKENHQLATWVNAQRALKREGKHSPESIRELDELGFVWEPRRSVWENMFDELVRYKQEHGDCRVPPRWNTNPELGNWVSFQRAERKRGRLSPTREERLEALGFVWSKPRNTPSAGWDAMFAELKRFKETHGHSNVSRYGGNAKLGNWVKHQRAFKKAGKLSPERVAKLNALGFAWVLPGGANTRFMRDGKQPRHHEDDA